MNPDICGVCGNLKQGNGKENEIVKMNKQEYLNELKYRLKNLPEPEIEKSLAFYAEIIDDRIEEGADEESAVAGLASPEAAAKEILADMPLGSIVRGGAKQVKKRMGGKPLLVVLAVIGSPIWLTLLLAAAIVLFSVAIVLAALWASLFICAAAVFGAGLLCLVQAAAEFSVGNPPLGVFSVGAALVLVSAVILLWKPLAGLGRLLLKAARLWIRTIKRLFVNRRAV